MTKNALKDKVAGNAISEALAARRRESEADFQQKITPYSEIAFPTARPL